MRVSDFDYQLPEELIAQEPAEERDLARLLVCELGSGRVAHRRVRDLPAELAAGDLLVLNDTRVIPVRLFGVRASGGRVELLLVAPDERPGTWRALVNPARKLKRGEVLPLEGGALVARFLERPCQDDGRPGPEWMVELGTAGGGPAGLTELERHGHVPLPPYIRRHQAEGDERREWDRSRYQTVYARVAGAVAAPTAGLHFTPELFARLEEAGVERAFATLHVGLGTFQPVKVEAVEDHRMHAERYELPEEAARAVRACRARGGRVVAVGTTSVRVLESCVDEGGELRAGSGETRLFLHPGRSLRVVDGLLTNFHLPRSSLLMLVSAFAGRERILELYRAAVARRYRFYSYGDAMLLTRPPR